MTDERPEDAFSMHDIDFFNRDVNPGFGAPPYSNSRRRVALIFALCFFA